MGRDGPDQAPEDGTYTWTDRHGEKHQVPVGIDPGWDYAPGASRLASRMRETVAKQVAGVPAGLRKAMPDITTPPRDVAFRKFLGDERVNILAQDAQQAAKRRDVSTAPLSIVDLASLRNYTGLTQVEGGERNHQLMNTALRSGDRAELKRLAPMILTLEAALANLPNYEGDVVRATNLPESVAKDIVPGGVYSDAGFMSTAIGETKFKGKYMFFIKSKTGKWIEPFSFYPDQREVLYPPGVEFVIRDVRRLDDGTVEVDLKEK
ncbi:MAG: hypothetical protein HQL65_10980 [Magnetococcales bacterium]|nr:hypothetical protein [Magnetococcales bacterium]